MRPRPSPLLTIARYTLLEALHNRLLWLAVAFILAAFALAGFAGSVSITDTVEIQSAVLGASLRACAVFTLCLFVITSMVREFNDKGFELVLSLPIRRATYLFGKLLGFCVLGVLLALLCLLPVLVYAPVTQALLWTASLACELALMTALCLLCLLTFSQVTLALSAVAAFYVAARSIGAVQLIAHGGLAFQGPLLQHFSRALVDAIAFALPALYRFTPSDWLVYHGAHVADLLPVLGQTLIYVALLVAAALFDLYRKSL